MRDLYLDPITRDLVLIAGRARLTTSDSDEAVAQHLQIRLGLWQGEYPFDLSEGIPYLALLGQKNGQTAIEQTLRRATTTSPGVDALLQFSMDVDADRHASVPSLVVRTTQSTIVAIQPFVAGDL